MKKYIDVENLKRALNNFNHTGTGNPPYYCGYDDCFTAIQDTIDDIPTADVVEVPCRCRDCANCEIVTDQFDNDWYFCKNTKDNAEVKPDGFCSYGEKR